MKIVNGYAVLENDSHISVWIQERNALDFDFYLYDHIKQYVPEGGTVMDLGAMVGDFTEFLRKRVGLNGRVLAFECNPNSYECLAYNMKDHANVTLYSNPVSDVVTDYMVIEPNENIGMAFIEPKTENSDPNGIVVQSVILDDMNLPKIDFVKIDIEGYEIEALNGMKNLIERDSPILVIEVNQHTLNRYGKSKQDLFDKITELGYTFTNVYPWIDMNGEQFDIVCKK